MNRDRALQNADDADAASQRMHLSLVSQSMSERDAAISELREFLLRGMSRALLNTYGNAVSIEDLVQDSLLKILHSLQQFEGRSRFTTWAMTIGMRTAISELRRKHYRNRSLDQWDGALVVDAGTEASIGDRQRLSQVLTYLQQLIDQELSVKQRTAIRGTLEGLPIEVIAERLGSNRNAIYKLVHDARLKLRKGLEARGVTADELHELFGS